MREAIAASGLPFRVESEARLAVIAFTGYLLWRDLDAHWERFLERPLARHLALSPTDSFAAGEPVTLGDTGLDESWRRRRSPPTVRRPRPSPRRGALRRSCSKGRREPASPRTITAILADQMAQGDASFSWPRRARSTWFATGSARSGCCRSRSTSTTGARPTEVRGCGPLCHRAQSDTDGFRMAASDVTTSGSVLEAYASRLHQRNGAGLSRSTPPARPAARSRRGPAPGRRAAVVGGAWSSDALRRVVADAVPALSASPRERTPAWGFARRRPAELAGLWAVLEAADAAVGDALTLVDALPSTSREVVEGAATSADLGAAAWLLSASSTDPAVAVEARSDRWRAARELWQRTREAQESSASLTARFAPEVASVDVEPVRQEVREASTSFFIGRKGRLVRAAAPVLAHLRPGATSTPRCCRRSSRRSPRPPTGRRRRPLLAPPARLRSPRPGRQRALRSGLAGGVGLGVRRRARP